MKRMITLLLALLLICSLFGCAKEETPPTEEEKPSEKVQKEESVEKKGPPARFRLHEDVTAASALDEAYATKLKSAGWESAELADHVDWMGWIEPGLISDGNEYQGRSADLSALDLTEEDYHKLTFDTSTFFPEALPESFDPAEVLERGKDPGLGVRALHERGITGKGVNVGIVDQALGNHIEYEGKVRYYYDPNIVRNNASMHGGAVLSILAGDTVGVAPDVKIYYACNAWGNWGDGTEEFYKNMFVDSIHHLLDLNETLPEEDKMSVISVSRGFDETMDVYKEVEARAESQGVWLLTCNLGTDFAGADRAYGADPNDPSVYGAPYWWDSTTHAFVPMNRRTTAAPNGGGPSDPRKLQPGLFGGL